MSSLAIVFRREIIERRNVVFTAAAAALIPLLIPMLPSVPDDSRPETRVFLALFLAGVFAAGVAVISGVSLFSRDLAEGRASFLFARPIGQASIWFGKIFAGLVLVFTTLALIAVPGLLLQREWPRGWEPPRFSALLVIAAVGVALLLLLLGNAVGVMVRSRKLLVLADFILATAVCTAGWGVFVMFARQTLLETRAVLVFVAVLAIITTIALLAGSFAQTAFGRVDVGRAHRALSLTLWPVLVAALSIVAAFVYWLPRVAPSDLVIVDSISAGSGTWLSVVGEGSLRPKGFYAGMLVDAADPARYVRIDTPTWSGNVAFSRDGRFAAWTEMDVASMPWVHARQRLVLADLRTLTRRRTDVVVDHPGRLVFADDGSRLALWDRKQVSVYDVATVRSLGTVNVEGTWLHMYFTPAGELRLLPFTQSPGASYETGSFALLTWNPSTRQVLSAGTLNGGRRLVADPTGARLLFDTGSSLELRDGVTGAFLAKLVEFSRGGRPRVTGTFLADGRIVTSRAGDTDNTLSVFQADGKLLREIALPRSEWLALNEEVGRDTLLVRAGNRGGKVRDFHTLVVDLAGGRITHVLADAIPASTWRLVDADPRTGPPATAVALWNPENGVVSRLDPATWKLVPLLGVPD